MTSKTSIPCAGLWLLVALFGLSTPVVAGTATEPSAMEAVKQETQDLLQALKNYTAEQRDAALRESKTALDSLDKRIEALEARIDRNWDTMDQAAREKARASLNELRRQRTRVAEWYGSLKSSSVEAWGHMKKGFADAYGDLQEAWGKSEREFGNEK